VRHVPLLIAGPGVTPGEVATPVQTVQLRATVRALLGLPPLRWIAPALPPWAGNWVAVERDGLKVVFDDRGRGRTYRLTDDPEENDPRPLAEGAPLVQAYTGWHRREWDVARAPSPGQRNALESLGYVH
jgi:hypothetical protein